MKIKCILVFLLIFRNSQDLQASFLKNWSPELKQEIIFNTALTAGVVYSVKKIIEKTKKLHQLDKQEANLKNQQYSKNEFESAFTERMGTRAYNLGYDISDTGHKRMLWFLLALFFSLFLADNLSNRMRQNLYIK